MHTPLNPNKLKHAFLHNLVKSPKDVKSAVKCSEMTDTIIVTPVCYVNGFVEELCFNRVSFCEDFTLKTLPSNTLVVMDSCIFFKSVRIDCAKGLKIIFRNCYFKEDLFINNVEPGGIEIQSTTYNRNIAFSYTRTESFFEKGLLNSNLTYN